ncbi:type II toxin-antitoxin system VapB family antitoxin [Polaromonas sp. P2-4]|nr:type II toxin-antitoxin system VapB family antitoxin [Polaromonas sp. P2-4]
MRTTINLDDELLAQAQLMSGLTERTQLLREALLALVQRESARRLAKLGVHKPSCSPSLAGGMSLHDAGRHFGLD